MNSEIERLAKEAGISEALTKSMEDFGEGLLSKLAALVAEDCAEVVTRIANEDAGNPYKQALRMGADAIRAKFALSGGEAK